MKVNISGKGIIPGLGILAPVYARDMQKSDVRRLLNFPKFSCYVTATGTFITKKNIDKLFNEAPKTTATKMTTTPAPKPVEKPVVVEQAIPDPTPVAPVEEVADPVELDVPAEGTVVEDIVDLDVVSEPEDVVDETIDEVVEETTDEDVEDDDVDDTEESTDETSNTQNSTNTNGQQYHNRNKKKRRHN